MATRVYKSNRKSRAKTSYASYKQNIRKLEKKGYTIDKEDILKKKDFDRIYNEWKARGKKNIARDMATDTVSYQYQRYQKYIESYKKKNYKLLDVIEDKESFSEIYKSVKASKQSVKDLANYSLEFQIEFAKNYAKEVNINDEEWGNYFTEKPKRYREYDEETGEEYIEYTPVDRKKIEKDIMSGKFEASNLFDSYMKRHNGYYYDESGTQHVLKSVREEFEGMYV